MDTAPSYRTNAIWAGIFFIIATAFLFVGEAFYGPVLSDPDVLTGAAGARNDIALGVLIEFACVLAIPLIAVALYPVLQRVSATLAIGYVAFRLFEAAVFFQTEVDKLLVLAISREFMAAPSANTDQINLLLKQPDGRRGLVGHERLPLQHRLRDRDADVELDAVEVSTGAALDRRMGDGLRSGPGRARNGGAVPRGLRRPRHNVDCAACRSRNGPGSVVHLQGI